MSEKPRAVILAAGCGRRMESELGGDPKCMLSFGEETLLERQFRILEECGIERCNILVVAGYSRDRLCIPSDASIIVNERFETTDNAYSLELALDSIRDVRGEVLVLDSDLAYDAESVEALLAAKGGSFLVSSESTDPSGTGVLVNGQGEVVAVGKHLVHTGLRYACAMKLTEKNRVDLLDILKKGDFEKDWYTVPVNKMLQRSCFGVAEAQGRIVKVGTASDYIHAKRVFGIEKLSVLLIGASGFLGTKMKQILSRSFEVAGTCRKGSHDLYALDPIRKNQVISLFDVVKPDIVVNLVGMSDPSACLSNQELAYDLNVRVVENICEACDAFDSKLIHISTDYVFDGEKIGMYETDDSRLPKNYYGHTKLMAEDIVSALPRHLIVRVPILYGYNSESDKPTFFSKVIDDLGAGRSVLCDDEQIRYPALIDEVCFAVRDRVFDCGVVHLSSEEPVTKYRWARIIADEFNLDESLLVPERDGLAKDRPRHVRLSTESGGTVLGDAREGARVVKHQRNCSFELIYRRKPLDTFKGKRIADYRIELGRKLALDNRESIPTDIDCAVPIPSSGLYYAMGFACESGIPYVQALVKEDTKERSFQLSTRDRIGSLKSNVIPMSEIVAGKRVALIDEAIFTGVTVRTVCDALKACGVKSIDVFIPTPPCMKRCPYYMQPDRGILTEEITSASMANYFRVRSVSFGARDTFEQSLNAIAPDICAECFLGYTIA